MRTKDENGWVKVDTRDENTLPEYCDEVEFWYYRKEYGYVDGPFWTMMDHDGPFWTIGCCTRCAGGDCFKNLLDRYENLIPAKYVMAWRYPRRDEPEWLSELPEWLDEEAEE